MLDTTTAVNLQARATPHNAVSLAEAIEVLRRRWLPFLLGVGLALAAGGAYLAVAKRSYSATAQVMIDTKRSDPSGAQFMVVDTSVVESQIETIKTDKIVVAVIKRLGLDQDPEFVAPGRLARLLSKLHLVRLEQASNPQARLRLAIAKFKRELNVTRIGPSYLANISFSSADPEKAARIANEVADAYIEDQLSARALSAERANSWMQKRATALRRQADSALQAAGNSSGEQKQQLEASAQAARQVYETFESVTRYAQNAAERAFPATEARIMSSALAPLKSTSPKVPIIGGVSLLAGFLLGALLAGVMEWLDHSIRSRDQLERDAGIRVLGFLPKVEKRRRSSIGAYVTALWRRLRPTTAGFSTRAFSLSWPRRERLLELLAERPAAAAKMLLGLRHAIDEGAESRSGKVIGITSPRANDGKTTLAFNLACFIAKGRCRVLLIDANLRNPNLTRVLSRRGSPPVPPCDDEPGAPRRPAISLGRYGFDLLENQQSLAAVYPPTSLDSSAMKELLEEVRGDYDYVIVDLPSILDDLDVSSCATLLDGLLMLVRFGRTRMDEVMDSLGELILVQDRLLGVVASVEGMPAPKRLGL